MTNQKERKLIIRYMKATMRFLIKARDMYVKGMAECSGQFDYVDAAAAVAGCPPGQFCYLPRTYSLTNSASARSSVSGGSSGGDDDFKELVRAASLRNQNSGSNNRIDDSLQMKKMARSRSVVIGRIDEDKPCDFEDYVEMKRRVYSRSRSYAVRRGRGGERGVMF